MQYQKLQDRLFVGCWNPPTGCYDWYGLLHKKSKNDAAVSAWAGLAMTYFVLPKPAQQSLEGGFMLSAEGEKKQNFVLGGDRGMR